MKTLDQKAERARADSYWALAMLVLSPAIYCWSGYVLSTMWGWFVVPLGVPAIGIAHAVGIGVVTTWVTHRTPRKTARPMSQLVAAVTTPAVVLLVGHVAHIVMGR